MLTFVKELIKSLLPLGLYLGTLATCVAAAAGYPFLALAMIAIASPLPNIWYQIQPFPMGKDVLDLLIASCFIGLVVGKHIKVSSRCGWLLTAYLLYTYLQVWNSSLSFGLPAPVTTDNIVLVYWKNYAEMILLYFIAFHVLGDEKRQQQLILLCMLVLFLIALREARNFTESVGAFSYDKRAAGPFWVVGLGANHFGAFIVHYAAVALALSFYIADRRIRWFLIVTAVICVKPLFFSYSRGAYLGALAVLFLYAVVKKRSLFVVLAVVLVSWQTLLPRTVVERISMTETSEGQLESSAADRVELWDQAYKLFQDNPVLGAGLGGFALSGVGGKYTSVHNLYLETMSDQGVVGLLFLIAVMFAALLSGMRLLWRGHTGFQKGMGLGFMGCALALMVTNIFGDRWSYFATGAYFWIFWGTVDRMTAGLVKGTSDQTIAAAPAAGRASLSTATTTSRARS